MNLAKEDFRSYEYPRFIIHNYRDIEDYQYSLEQLSSSYEFLVTFAEGRRLPHYRYFEFKSDDLTFSVRIDGGIAHGFKPVQRITSDDLSLVNEVFDIRKDVYHDVIYNISLEESN